LSRGSLQWGGVERSFLLGPAARPDLPLLIALHGGGGQAAGMVRLSDLARRGAQAGFATVFPNGVARGWNDGRNGSAIAERAGIDDVGFLLALIDHLAARRVADPAKVFCCGISNGAFMSDALARRAPERLAGIGLVAGTAGTDQMWHRGPSAHPLPVVLFHGDADPIVPYAGGTVGPSLAFGRRRTRRLQQRRGVRNLDTAAPDRRGGCVGAEAVAQDWAIAAGCDLRPTVERLPMAPGDLGVVRSTWEGPAGVPVVLHRVERGGHTWPGGPQYLPARLIGPTATSLDATGILLATFSS
jgi:polyhydroxybutyrate depolymerase